MGKFEFASVTSCPICKGDCEDIPGDEDCTTDEGYTTYECYGCDVAFIVVDASMYPFEYPDPAT